MSVLDGPMDKAAKALASIEEEREETIRLSRAVIRLSKSAIHAIHTGCDPSEDLASMRERIGSIISAARDPSVLSSGPVQDCMCEYSEAVILDSIVSGSPVPDHESLRVSPSAWVLGACDCEGELRRMVMSKLMEGDLEGARRMFALMEDVHERIMMLDVADPVAPVRRKQDIARGIMDRTRSDMLNAVLSYRKRKPMAAVPNDRRRGQACGPASSSGRSSSFGAGPSLANSRISPGWQSRTSQMASSVESLMALTFPVLSLERLTLVIPTLLESSTRVIFLSSMTRSKRMIIGILTPCPGPLPAERTRA